MKGSGATVPKGVATAAVALAITLAIQIYASAAATATSVLAPEIGRDLGHRRPSSSASSSGILYAGSMIASLASGMFIARHGPIRVSQVCVLLCAAGALLVAVGTMLPGVALFALAVAPLVIGIGYGPITPASSHILARTAPPSRMALTFSIKQTGVPAGAALAGASLPILALQIGWREAFAVIAVLGIVVALDGPDHARVARRRTNAAHACRRSPESSRRCASSCAVRRWSSSRSSRSSMRRCRSAS